MTESELEEPIITPLVRALTRAPTLLGVPYLFFMFNGVITSCLFLMSHNLFMLLSFIPIHIVGYLATIRDDRIFEILAIRFRRSPPLMNAFWNATSYKV